MGSTGRILSWREPILQHFNPEIAKASRITLVSDPDRLLAEQRIVAELQERGFEVVAFEDPVTFRFVYESRFRGSRADNRLPHLVVARQGDVTTLPYDLVCQARQDARIIALSLAELFPHLAPNVIAELDRDDLDLLYQAQEAHQPEPLGENATKDFILRHVYGVAPELIKSTPELVRVLLRRHYAGKRYAKSLDERFITLVDKAGQFKDWPLQVVIPDRAAFIAFLQERWAWFVRRKTGAVIDPSVPQFVISGVADLPFDHPDIRVYVDSLFIEGVLKPIRDVSQSSVAGTWLTVGVAGDEEADAEDRFAKLTKRIESQIPADNAAYSEWTAFAFRWGEWNLLRHRLTPAKLAETGIKAEALSAQVESVFEEWMLKNYGSLSSLAYIPTPVMVHQVAKEMSHGWSVSDKKRKLALVVIDGLAIDQWLVLRESLGDGIQTRDDGIFAWVPTLTPVSRQAIFAAEPPLYFASSLDTTAKEEQHWTRFWENAGARRPWISFAKQKSQEPFASFISRVRDQIEQPGCCILGAVVGVIDETLHGTVLGSGGLHAQVRYWAEAGHLRNLLELLLNADFEIIVTADHGNIEAGGMGKPNVGVVAEERGERAHVFTDDSVRQNVQKAYPLTLSWPQIGLPPDYLPLIARGASAFIGEGQRSVSHGGASLEEVIVPFVRVSRKR